MILYKELSDEIIHCFYKVYNSLGYGFLENVYENALMKALSDRGMNVKAQYPINVFYEGIVVGKFFADIVVEDKIILELKAIPLEAKHNFQLLNYLRATEIEVGYLLSFCAKPEFKRKVFSNEKKI